MRRSVPPRKGSRKQAQVLVTRSDRVDLVLIDASPRRRHEKDRYGARCREAEDAGARLKTFEEREVPAFAAWIDREFEREIARLRQEQAHVRELHDLVMDVERYAAWTEVSLGVALDRVRRAKAEGTEAELWREATGEDFEDETSDFEDDEDDEGDEGDEGDAEFARRFAEAFDDAFGEEAGYGRQGATKRHPPQSRDDRTSQDYLKSIYRQLVRVLHPDTNPDRTDQALWQEVQDAYSWGDVARLERLRQVVLKGGERGLNLDFAPIGDIIGLRKSVESRLRKLKTSLKSAKAHPAWDFLQAREVAARLRQLKREFGAAMADDLIQMQHERHQLERWIAACRGPVRKAQRSPRQPRYCLPSGDFAAAACGRVSL